MTIDNGQGGTPHRWTIRDYLVSGGSLLLVVAVMVALYLNRDWVAGLGSWGYLGAFIIGLVANATVFLPMPGLLILFPLGATFNPVLIGLAGAAGGALGELAGYVIGYSGHAFIRDRRMFEKARGWMQRWGAAAVFVFALVPVLPLDLAGIAAGMVRYPFWKFLLACFAGKAVLYVVLTVLTSFGWSVIEPLLA